MKKHHHITNTTKQQTTHPKPYSSSSPPLANRRGLSDLSKDNKKDGVEEFSNVGGSSSTACLRPTTRNDSGEIIDEIAKQAQNTTQEDIAGAAPSDITITIYNNGVRIGNEPFQALSADQTQQLLQAVKNGDVPPELEKLMKGTDASVAEKVAIKLDIKKEDYVDPNATGFNFAASRGMSLLDQPLQRNTELSQVPPQPYVLNPDDTKMTIQLVLTNRTRIRLQVNHTTTIEQLYQHINSIEGRGGLTPEQHYTLVGGFPVKEYNVGTVTVGEAKLAGSSLQQQIVQK